MNILFRCDGSVEIGMGHVVCCLALADHLKEHHNCNIYFAMRRSELGISKVQKSYPVLKSEEKTFNYTEWLSDCILQTQADTLIMDMRDGLTREQLNSIKKHTGIKMVTIDDPEDKRLESDLAFYPPVPQLEKVNWDDFKGKLCVGWEYVILRKEFLKQYPKPNNNIPKILVSMGGTDEKNMTEFVVNALSQVNEQFKAVITVGSGYPYLKQLKKTLEKIQFEFELRQNPKNIAEIMSQTNFAIISFGQTAYELATLNVPTLYICLTDDHLDSSRLFMNEGIGTTIGLLKDVKKQDIVEAVIFHLTEKNILKEMSLPSYLLHISDLFKISQLILQEDVYA